MHRIHCPARRIGCDRREERGVENTEADFLALHVAVGDSNAKIVMNRVARRLGPPAEENAADK